MNPRLTAIRIADKYLSGEPLPLRRELALEISVAIVRHASMIAVELLEMALEEKNVTRLRQAK
jgi:hypothetical protein